MWGRGVGQKKGPGTGGDVSDLVGDGTDRG